MLEGNKNVYIALYFKGNLSKFISDVIWIDFSLELHTTLLELHVLCRTHISTKITLSQSGANSVIANSIVRRFIVTNKKAQRPQLS